MDNIWIFLIIAGAIASFSQKGQNKRPQTGSEQENLDTEGIPQESPLERRLRELIENSEGKVTENSQPSENDTNTPQKRFVINKPTNPSSQQMAKQKPMPSLQTSFGRVENQPSTKVHQADFRKKIKPTMAITANTNPIKESEIGSKNDIEAILEDFSMEKAVIYSEILKPKYEEL